MAGESPETFGGMRLEAIIVGQTRTLTLRAPRAAVNRFVGGEPAAFFGLTDVLDVADDAIIDCNALGVEPAIVMPVDIAVRVEIFADNRTGDVRSAIDREVRGRGVEHRGKPGI